MNKGAHISLALFLLDKLESNELESHKKAFLIGSILPDCRPSFLTTRHTISDTLGLLLSEIRAVTVNYNKAMNINAYVSIHLGIIMHYLADYYTFPHNTGYSGNMKEHIEYEREQSAILKKQMKEADVGISLHRELRSIEDISLYIIEQHGAYLNDKHDMTLDSSYIIRVCYTIATGILKQIKAIYMTEQDGKVEAA